MVTSLYFSRAWGLRGVLTAIIAGIVISSAAFSGRGMPLHAGSVILSYQFDLSAPNLMSSEARVYVNRYLNEIREETEVVLGRAQVFFPDIETALEEAGLPNGLKYLPMIESTLLPEVVSPSGAAGLWQIMPSTARYLGLRVDKAVDERLDPRLSGKAAIRLLQELYVEFGDWPLALAAYNCGPGRVRRAIEKSGSKDYSRLRIFLPLQTRSYLSKFVAMAHIAEFWQKYGLNPKNDFGIPAIKVKEVSAQDYLDFQEIAVQLGISSAALRRLNPGFRFEDARKGVKSRCKLMVPEHIAYKLEAQPAASRTKRLSGKNNYLLAGITESGDSRSIWAEIWGYLPNTKEISVFSLTGMREALQRDGLSGTFNSILSRYFPIV